MLQLYIVCIYAVLKTYNFDSVNYLYHIYFKWYSPFKSVICEVILKHIAAAQLNALNMFNKDVFGAAQ